MTDEQKTVRVLIESDPETGLSYKADAHVAVANIPIEVFERWERARDGWHRTLEEVSKMFEHGGGHGW